MRRSGGGDPRGEVDGLGVGEGFEALVARLEHCPAIAGEAQHLAHAPRGRDDAPGRAAIMQGAARLGECLRQ
jgi:hypothetical protein